MDKFQNQYRIETARAVWWNYSNSGYYFITICTHQREKFFGKIEYKQLQINELGILVDDIWNIIPEKFDFVDLDKYVIMPNHIHGILMLRSFDGKIQTDNSSTKLLGITGYNNPMDKNNLGRVINWFKGRVTYEINIRFPDANFGWQSRFHDRIIRNNEELLQKQIYIQNNPMKWIEDELFL